MLDAVRTSGMRRMALRAAAIATMTAIAGLGLAPSSMAADLNGDQYIPKPHAGSPYDDPRYAELYGHDERHRHSDEYRARGQHAYDRHDNDIYYDRHGNRISRPDRSDYYADRRRYDRYDDRPYYRKRHRFDPWRDHHSQRRWKPGWRSGHVFRDNCVPRRVVLRRLRRDGWYNFHDLRFHGPKATVAADNESGGRYRLVIHRCSGSVVKARRLDYRHTGYRGRYDGRDRDYRSYK